MARTARIVVPGVAHHVTQRGNRRQQTFFCPADYARYIDLIAESCREFSVDVLAWCLMPNHVHLVLVPKTEAGLAQALAVAHQHYTWGINRRNGWQGHLWQGRFFSSPLDDPHLVAAVRYVELNPVRAGMVTTPEQWRWSSACGRIRGSGDKLVRAALPPALQHVGDWTDFLAEGLGDEELARIRLHALRGAALGSAEFIAGLEMQMGLSLHRRPRGRPRAENGDAINGDSHQFRSRPRPSTPNGAGNW